MMNFKDSGLDSKLIRATDELGFVEMTPIQEKTVEHIKAGRDCVAQSSTGSGKTAAFGLPILEKIDPHGGIQLVALTPTRELCVQVSDALISFSKYIGIKVVSVFGGVSISPQIEGLKRAQVMVGTPGRVLDHLRQRTMDLRKVRWLVIDEADKMLEMGFIEDVETIISQIPKERQTMLFSATIPGEIRSLVDRYLTDPIHITIDSHIQKNLLRQVFYNVDQHDKFSLLAYLLKNKTSGLAMVFCGTRDQVDVLTKNLRLQKIEAMAIHGGLSQNKRTDALNSLKNKNIDVLVATDVAARGLDIKNVSHIYNYDVPKTPNDYIHRIGRTARAGADGDAVTILSQRDYENFNSVLSDRQLEIENIPLPDFPRVPFIARSRYGSSFEGEDSGRGRFGERREGPGSGFRPRSGSGYGASGDSRSGSSSGFRGRSSTGGSYGGRSGSGSSYGASSGARSTSGSGSYSSRSSDGSRGRSSTGSSYGNRSASGDSRSGSSSGFRGRSGSGSSYGASGDSRSGGSSGFRGRSDSSRSEKFKNKDGGFKSGGSSRG
jgi:ATP-dependent RNA helicase DeaD